MTIGTCQVCNEKKEVCCSYEGKNGYIYCRDCCPWKKEHITSRQDMEIEQEEPENHPNYELKQQVLRIRSASPSTVEDAMLDIIDQIIDRLK